MNLVNGLSGDYPIYEYRVLPPNSYAEGIHFLNRMYVNQETVEDADSLLLALILFAEFQHHPGGGSLGEEEAQTEFIEVRRQLGLPLFVVPVFGEQVTITYCKQATYKWAV